MELSRKALVPLALLAIAPIAMFWILATSTVIYAALLGRLSAPEILQMTVLVAAGGFGLYGAAIAARHALSRPQSYRNRVLAQIGLVAGAALVAWFGLSLLAGNVTATGTHE